MMGFIWLCFRESKTKIYSMKKIYLLLLFIPLIALGQQPYYDDTPVYLTDQELYDALQTTLSQVNTGYTYGEFRDDLKITDENPANGSEVLLIYGFNDTDGDCTTDLTRSDLLFGGDNCEYNREHVFPRSIANPPMGSVSNGTTGIAADPHNLRPSDVQRNGSRGSKRFTDGTGNSGTVNADFWYPGDEWKGDVARAMMYMYVRYGDRCLPSLVGTGLTQGDTDMLELFLQWNVDDPVSELEEQRNPFLENTYGNRNPFIDNPILATIIWGGPAAEDKWGPLSFTSFNVQTTTLFPNPTENSLVFISTAIPVNSIEVFTLQGKKIIALKNKNKQLEHSIPLGEISPGIYLIKIDDQTHKLLVK